MRFAKRSSIRPALLVVAVGLATVAAVLSGISHLSALAVARLATAVGAAAALALYLFAGERHRHEVAEEELSAQARFLESLVESMGAIATRFDSNGVLEQARGEAERLFAARVTLVWPGEVQPHGHSPDVMEVPITVRDEHIATLVLKRDRPFQRGDLVRATVLADFAARACENARLLAEAQVREAERLRLSDQLITAEQEERRRLAVFLHDTAVQSLSGIALMLDAGLDAMEAGRVDDARKVLSGALERHRQTIGSLRDLSFALEPVVLRDQGFAPAVRALGDQLGMAHRIQFDVEVDAAEQLAEKVQAALYQIIREALHQAIRRGPPQRIAVRVDATEEGGIETVISDDAPGERRRASFEAIAERARTLNGQLIVEPGRDGGTAVRVVLPSYAASR